MSTTANWSYANTATVWPLESEGSEWNGGKTYGTPYQIKCTWAGGGDIVSNLNGEEVTPAIRFWHEDSRVKAGDWIARGAETDRMAGMEIKAHVEYDMSPFNQLPDFMSVC